MGPQEFAALYLSSYPSEPLPEMHSQTVVQQVMDPAPTSWDWTEHGIVNAIKDQGKCTAQWAFSSVASIESEYAKIKGTLYNLSEQ